MQQRSDIMNVHDSFSPVEMMYKMQSQVANGNVFILPGVNKRVPQQSSFDLITQDVLMGL